MALHDLLDSAFDIAMLLAITASVCIAFGGLRVGKWIFLLALVVVALPAVPEALWRSLAEWRKWLAGYVDDRVVIYALGVVGFLVAMNLLRHVLAFFVGYGAADSAVGNLLASTISSVFLIFMWPFRAVRRATRGLRPEGDDP